MKKSFFGYKRKEVEKEINFLNDIISQLKSTISTLESQNLEIKTAQEELLKTSKAKEEDTEEKILLWKNEYNRKVDELEEVSLNKEELISENRTLIEKNHQLNRQIEELTITVTQLHYLNDEKVKTTNNPPEEFDKNLMDKVSAASLEPDIAPEVVSLTHMNEVQQDLGSKLSLRAFKDMSYISNQVMHSLHELMKEYYTYVNNNNARVRKEIAMLQEDYKTMIATFLDKSNQIPDTLRKIESDYTQPSKFSIDTQPLIDVMNETINKYMLDANNALTKDL